MNMDQFRFYLKSTKKEITEDQFSKD
jgi:hypothetical protein